MLCLSAFELYSRWVPLNSSTKLPRLSNDRNLISGGSRGGAPFIFRPNEALRHPAPLSEGLYPRLLIDIA